MTKMLPTYRTTHYRITLKYQALHQLTYQVLGVDYFFCHIHTHSANQHYFTNFTELYFFIKDNEVLYLMNIYCFLLHIS